MADDAIVTQVSAEVEYEPDAPEILVTQVTAEVEYAEEYGLDLTPGCPVAASGSFSYSAYPPMAINDHAASFWASNTVALPHWWKIDLQAAYAVKKLTITARNDSYYAQAPVDFKLQGSSTGAFGGEEVDVYTTSGLSWTQGEKKTFEFANSTAYRHWRIYITMNGGVGGGESAFAEVEMFSMDGNGFGDCFEGSCIAYTQSSAYSGSYYANKAVDDDNSTMWVSSGKQSPYTWVKYQFPSPRAVKRLSITSRPSYQNETPKDFKLQGSATGVFAGEEVDLLTVTGSSGWGATERRLWEIPDPTYRFFYFRVAISANDGGGNVSMAELELIPHHNEDLYSTAPGSFDPSLYGPDITQECEFCWESAAYAGTELIDKAIDDNPATSWYIFTGTWPQHGTFHYTEYGRVIQAITIQCVDPGSAPKDFELWGSNTGAFSGEQTVLKSVTGQTGWMTGEKRGWGFANITPFRFYRLNVTATNSANYLKVAELELLRIKTGEGAYLKTATGPDQTPGSTVSASVVADPAHPPAHAIDDDIDTYYTTGNGQGPPQWYQVDFGAGNAKTIGGLSLTVRNDSYYNTCRPVNFELRASNTGVFGGEEVTLLSLVGIHEWNQGETRHWVFDNSVAYRYYRFYSTSHSTTYGYGFAEIQLREPDSGTFKDYSGLAALASQTSDISVTLLESTWKDFSGLAALASQTGSLGLNRLQNILGAAALASQTGAIDLSFVLGFAGTAALASATNAIALKRLQNIVGIAPLASNTRNISLSRLLNVAGLASLRSVTTDMEIAGHKNIVGIARLISLLSDLDLTLQSGFKDFLGQANLQTLTSDIDTGRTMNFIGAAALASQTGAINLNRLLDILGQADLESSTGNISLGRILDMAGTASLQSFLSDLSNVDLFRNLAGTAALQTLTGTIILSRLLNLAGSADLVTSTQAITLLRLLWFVGKADLRSYTNFPLLELFGDARPTWPEKEDYEKTVVPGMTELQRTMLLRGTPFLPKGRPGDLVVRDPNRTEKVVEPVRKVKPVLRSTRRKP